MLDKRPYDMDWLYSNFLPFVSLYPSNNYKVVKAYTKEVRDKELGFPPNQSEAFLSPITVFDNGYVYDSVKNKKEFIVALGIFDLDPSSAVATVTKDNKLTLTWTERAGKGKFTSKIPSYLVATSAPVLSYEGGVLDIRVNVKSRSENDVVFVGKLESK